jgi:histidinol-phosphatase (PHP family)
MIYRTDYHIHTLFSDGRAWPEDYLAEAAGSGLSEIGFSDHLTLNDTQQEWAIKPSLLGEYFERISRLKEQNSKIKVRIGLEVDYFPGREELIYNTIKVFPFDYIIGAVHFLGDDSVDVRSDFYENRDIEKLFEQYFRVVGNAAGSGLFDIMAHPDLVRIFRYLPADNPENLYRDLASTLKKHDVAYEINTNGMNKPLSDFYPDRRFIHLFREEGVPVCVNSDAHNPRRLAQYFDEAYGLVVSAGYKEMAVFEKGERLLVPIPVSGGL